MIPASTYRLQLNARFGLDAAADLVPYLRDLGVGWVYLSPILQATDGSEHGYDVVDATRVDAARGGPEALQRFATAAHEAGLGVLVDIVPNHMGVGDPRQNAWWWDLLRRGRASRWATTFDVDWDAGDGRILLPILGAELEQVLAANEITVAPDGTARYFDHVLPLAEGTAPAHETSDAGEVGAVLARQHWMPIFWRRGDAELNYRRFFTVTSLAGVRVEDPAVFDATHAEVLRWLDAGLVDGLRLDHPDGLADPGAYIERLSRATLSGPRARRGVAPGAPGVSSRSARSTTEEGSSSRSLSEAAAGGADETSSLGGGGAAAYIVIEPFDTPAAPATQGPGGAAGRGAAAYIVIEKILEPGEELPATWAEWIAGTTGYDALAEIDRVLVDPAGEAELSAIDAGLRAETGLPPLARYADTVHEAKRDIAETALRAEVRRLRRMLPASDSADLARATRTEDALTELLAAFPVYRAYLPDGDEYLAVATEDAARRRPELAAQIRALADRMRTDPHGAFTLRFMQTAGPVMAKGVEDRTFYRYSRLTSLTEVGGDPSLFAMDGDEFHAARARRQRDWPHTMTALSTHDTKRSADTRARIAVLAEIPHRWAEVLGHLRAIASTGDGPFDNLLWQAIVGVWPAAPDRLHEYAIKAAREAAQHTTWTDPAPRFEERVHELVLAAHGRAVALLNEFTDEIRGPGRSNALAACLLQLAGPGVPDVYQGTELWAHDLVDPDNRRPVDIGRRRRLLAELDDGWMPDIDDTGAVKLLLTSRVLRLRRNRPELFAGYTALRAEGSAADHVVAFARSGVIAVATRLPVGLVRGGGWRDTSITLPATGGDRWRDVLSGRVVTGGEVRVAGLLHRYPVALLVAESSG